MYEPSTPPAAAIEEGKRVLFRYRGDWIEGELTGKHGLAGARVELYAVRDLKKPVRQRQTYWRNISQLYEIR